MTSQDNKRIAKNTVFLYVRMLIVLALSLYTTRVVLNVLGIVDYGIYNVVCGFVSMFAFLNNSLANGTQRFYNFKLGKNKRDEVSLVFSSSMLIQIVLAIILLLLLESFGFWYTNNKMIIPAERITAALWVFHCAVASLILVVLQVPYSAAILAFEKMDYYALVSIIDAILKLSIVIVLPFIDADHLVIYGILTLFISLITYCFYAVYCRLKFKEETTMLWRKKEKTLLREMTSFSGWNVFGTFAYMIKDQGLNVLLNSFFGPVVNAARGIAMQINSALQGFSTNIVAAIRPQLVQSYSAGNITRVENMMFSMSRLIFVMLYILSLPIMIELPYILKLWLSGNIPDYTIVFSDLIIINMIITSMNTPLSQVVHATGKMKYYQIGTSLTICTILPISYIFLKLGYSPVSTFVISIVTSIINQVICLFLLRRIFPFSIKTYVKDVVFPCSLLILLTPIIPLSVHYLLPDGFIRLVSVVLVGILSTALLSYFVVLTITEKQLVFNYIDKNKTKYKK